MRTRIGIFPTIYYIVDETSINCILIAVGLMFGQHAFEARYSRDTAEIQPRYSRDTAEMQP